MNHLETTSLPFIIINHPFNKHGDYDEKSSTVGVAYFQTQPQPQLFGPPTVTLGPAAETARVSRERKKQRGPKTIGQSRIHLKAID